MTIRIDICTTNNKVGPIQAIMQDMAASLKMLNARDTGTYVFLAALVTLFISLVEILDYFELPFESLAGHLFASGSVISAGFVTSFMTTFGYGGVFVLMLLESASLPIPSEVVLPFAGYLVVEYHDLWPLLLAGFLAAPPLLKYLSSL